MMMVNDGIGVDMEEAVDRKSLYGFEMREPDLRRSDERKTYDIKQLWQRSHEILSLAVRGLKQTEIAEALNISPQTVSNTLNSDLGMQKLSILRKDSDEKAAVAAEKIDILTQQALAVYGEIFEDDSGQVNLMDKKKTSDSVILDLSGLRVPVKVQSHGIHTTASLKEIEEFKQRGIKAAREAGMIIDIEEVKVSDPKPKPALNEIDQLLNDLEPK